MFLKLSKSEANNSNYFALIMTKKILIMVLIILRLSANLQWRMIRRMKEAEEQKIWVVIYKREKKNKKGVYVVKNLKKINRAKHPPIFEKNCLLVVLFIVNDMVKSCIVIT